MAPFFTFSLMFICLIVRIAVCRAVTNVALAEFRLAGNTSPINFYKLQGITDAGQELLCRKYGDIMNVTRVSLSDRNVTTCAKMEQKAPFWLTRYYYQQAERNPLMALFGPECSASAVTIASFAREWNMPMFVNTLDNYESSMSNKTRYPTLTRLSPYIQEDLNEFVFKIILKKFSYTNVAFLCDDANDITHTYVPLCGALSEYRHNLRYWNVTTNRFFINASDSVSVKYYLEVAKTVARVVIVIAHGSRIRPVMLAAYDSDMTNGDYVYFNFEFYPSQRLFGNMSWYTNNKDGRDQDAREAYRSLLMVSLRPDDAPEYKNFTKEIKRLSTENYGYTYADEEDVDPVAMSHYYAMAIYGQVLKETLAMGVNSRDGRAMSKLIWNRTFTILGSDIVINANGDRDANWLVNQMDPRSGIFRPVMEYSAREPSFLRTNQDPITNTYRPIPWQTGNGLPPNEPPCGYNGDKPQCGRDIRDNLLS